MKTWTINDVGDIPGKPPLTDEEKLEFVEQWNAQELTKVSRRWAVIRQKRNELLKNCDWTQLADATLSEEKKQTWLTYRQALRDLPQSYDDPEKVVWPELPQ